MPGEAGFAEDRQKSDIIGLVELNESHPLQNKIIKNMKPAERLRIAFELNELVRERLKAFFKEKNPKISPQELSFLVKKRLSKMKSQE